MARSSPSGHRPLPHTADSTIEAWGPTRAACLEQALAGLVAGYADTADVVTTRSLPVAFEPVADDELLLRVLEEAIALGDILGEVVVRADLVDGDDGGVTGFFELAPVASVTQIGAPPKAVTRHGLSLRQAQADHWTALATVDV